MVSGKKVLCTYGYVWSKEITLLSPLPTPYKKEVISQQSQSFIHSFIPCPKKSEKVLVELGSCPSFRMR